MEKYEGLIFTELSENDIDALVPIMKCAFDKDTQIHLGGSTGGPLGYDNGDFLRKYALDKQSTAYTIMLDKKVIGAVILWINEKTNRNFLGNVFIDVNLQNEGIGKKIWDFVENKYPNSKVWRTETPIFSHRNHHFYINKCGFHVIKIENPKDLEKGSFILEKVM